MHKAVVFFIPAMVMIMVMVMVMVHWSPAVAELDFLMAAMAMAAQVKITILAAIALWQMGWGAEIDTAPSESYGAFFDLEISVFWFFYLLTGANMSCFLADHQIGDGFGAGVSNVIVVKLGMASLFVSCKQTYKQTPSYPRWLPSTLVWALHSQWGGRDLLCSLPCTGGRQGEGAPGGGNQGGNHPFLRQGTQEPCQAGTLVDPYQWGNQGPFLEEKGIRRMSTHLHRPFAGS